MAAIRKSHGEGKEARAQRLSDGTIRIIFKLGGFPSQPKVDYIESIKSQSADLINVLWRNWTKYSHLSPFKFECDTSAPRCCDLGYGEETETQTWKKSDSHNPRIEYDLLVQHPHLGLEFLSAHSRLVYDMNTLVNTKKLQLQYAFMLDSPCLLANDWSPCSRKYPLESLSFCSVANHSKLLLHKILKKASLLHGLEAAVVVNWVTRSSPPFDGSANQEGGGAPNGLRHRFPSAPQQGQTLDELKGSPQSMHSPCGRSLEGLINQLVLTRETGIGVVFEHDRRVLNIRFYIRQAGSRHAASPSKRRPRSESPRSDEKIDLSIAELRLEIKYSSIKHVFFRANRPTHKKDVFELELVMRVKHPPTIHRMDAKDLHKVSEGENAFFGGGRRIVGWNDKDNSDSEVGAIIAYSSLIKLNFSDITREECARLLGRLRASLPEWVVFETRNWSYAEERLPDLKGVSMAKELPNNFGVRYALDSLFARGSVVGCHLRTPQEKWVFAKAVAFEFKRNSEKTILALERLLDVVDECDEFPSLLLAFQRQVKLLEREKQTGQTPSSIRSGYVMMRKVVITPSRVIPQARETVMGNMAVRFSPSYPSDHFLRVIFRNEDGSHMWRNTVGDDLIAATILARLRGHDPDRMLCVGGESYNLIGCSNSQMRDRGAYFLRATVAECDELRQRFCPLFTPSSKQKEHSVAKKMSRLGQCFTQALVSSVDTSRFERVGDYLGGSDRNGDPYNFSDGCGSISLRAATHIAEHDLKLLYGCVPSCFQFRSWGYKGVLAVDPSLDARRKKVDFLFRKSQRKFEAECSGQLRLEIVKYSSPALVYLCRPLINILDQASKLHPNNSHHRIYQRILALLEEQIFILLDSLLDDRTAKMRLREMPSFIHYGLLADAKINFTRDPFFIGLLRASARVQINKLRSKHNIAIPSHLGRVMFGVVDTTGKLQPGQVFVQWSCNAHDNCPSKFAKRKVQKGKVLITKNPCIVAGDVRVFEAVDVEELREALCDVVVFPNHGDRPHPDEMAGSDLDGDEYVVICDEDLLLEQNEPALDYTTPEQSPTKNNREKRKTQVLMADFYRRYITNDAVGRVATAHLCVSDLYGLACPVSEELAIKHAKAVDFPKTGAFVQQLSNSWLEDEDEPPEMHERAPDFKEYEYEPSYRSWRLNGEIFREVRSLAETIEDAVEGLQHKHPEVDLLFVVNGCEKLSAIAAAHYEDYASALKNLMARYGIMEEGELFSNSYFALKNTLSERENDDMSFYTTRLVIEEKLRGIWMEARRKLFELGGSDTYEALTELPRPSGYPQQNTAHPGEWHDFSRRVSKEPAPDRLKQLASAYYLVAYAQTEKKLLSFAWLGSDLLSAIHRQMRMNLLCSSEEKFTFKPLGTAFSKQIEKMATGKRVKHYCETILEASKGKEMTQLLERNIGLGPLLYYTLEWAKERGAGGSSALLLRLIVKIGSCKLDGFSQKHPIWDPEERRAPPGYMAEEWISLTDFVNLNNRLGGTGEFFLDFIRFLASRHFRELATLGQVFDRDEITSISQGEKEMREWLLRLNMAAAISYQTIAFTGELDDPPNRGRGACNREAHFTIEVPPEEVFLFEEPTRIETLKEKTGCAFIAFRPQPLTKEMRTQRVIVTLVGNRRALNAARDALTVTAEDPMQKPREETLFGWVMRTLVLKLTSKFAKMTEKPSLRPANDAPSTFPRMDGGPSRSAQTGSLPTIAIAQQSDSCFSPFSSTPNHGNAPIFY